MDIHRFESGPMPSLDTSLHLFLFAHRRAHIAITVSRYGRSGGVLSHIVGEGVRGLVVSPLWLVEFTFGNDLLPPLPSSYVQLCMPWEIKSPPPPNRGKINHNLWWKGSGLGTKH